MTVPTEVKESSCRLFCSYIIKRSKIVADGRQGKWMKREINVFQMKRGACVFRSPHREL